MQVFCFPVQYLVIPDTRHKNATPFVSVATKQNVVSDFLQVKIVQNIYLQFIHYAINLET